MGMSLNRRQWLKTTVWGGAGLAAGALLPACKPDTQTTVPALPGEGENLIILRSNESPYGLSPQAIEAVVSSPAQSHRYPHRKYHELITLIAEEEDVSPDCIILGGGSTEIMTMLIHLYASGRPVLAADPTYFDFIDYAEKADCSLELVPLNDRYEHDLFEMEGRITDETGLVYICNPNNPTGSLTPKENLQSFCERVSLKIPVVVDEAYHEYAEDSAYASMLDLVKKGKNIIVTRTFSKIYGMAGLRVGYGLAPPEIIESLKRIQRNFASIAYPSLQAAMAGYRDREYFNFVKRMNNAVKNFLYQELEKRGYTHIIPSHTNFVLFEIDQDPEAAAQRLEKHGILIRTFSFKEKSWIRVSLGTRAEVQAFISALPEIA